MILWVVCGATVVVLTVFNTSKKTHSMTVKKVNMDMSNKSRSFPCESDDVFIPMMTNRTVSILD